MHPQATTNTGLAITTQLKSSIEDPHFLWKFFSFLT